MWIGLYHSFVNYSLFIHFLNIGSRGWSPAWLHTWWRRDGTFISARGRYCFYIQKSLSPTAQLKTIILYISRTWMHSSTRPPSSWSIFYQTIRTNNDIERWHNRINTCAADRSNLHFYLLVNFLHNEAKLTSVYIRLVSEKTKNCEGSNGKIYSKGIYRVKYSLFGTSM